jgi:hypothetical protein
LASDVGEGGFAVDGYADGGGWGAILVDDSVEEVFD